MEAGSAGDVVAPAGSPAVGGSPAADGKASDRTLVSIHNLKTYYPIRAGILRRVVGNVRAVDDVSFDIRRGEIFGLVGESGCGKTTLRRTLLRLEEPTRGSPTFHGTAPLPPPRHSLSKPRRR